MLKRKKLRLLFFCPRENYISYNESIFLKGVCIMNIGQRVIYAVGVYVVSTIAISVVSTGVGIIAEKIKK